MKESNNEIDYKRLEVLWLAEFENNSKLKRYNNYKNGINKLISSEALEKFKVLLSNQFTNYDEEKVNATLKVSFNKYKNAHYAIIIRPLLINMILVSIFVFLAITSKDNYTYALVPSIVTVLFTLIEIGSRLKIKRLNYEFIDFYQAEIMRSNCCETQAKFIDFIKVK